MYERFSTEARQSVAEAQVQARLLGHRHIGSEHLLLGVLAQGEGTAAATLEMLALDPESVRGQVLALASTGPGTSQESIPLTRGAKKVLERTLAEALKAGHRFVGAEHILLALIRDDDGIAGQVLTGMGADLQAARGFVAGLVEESGLPPGVVIEPRQPRKRVFGRRKGREPAGGSGTS
jgi:ATP-dependent Clp protease ATP-binding subunit ClpC